MHINLFVFNAILTIGCQKTPVDNPYDAPTTYAWTKQDLNDFSNELKQSEADLVATLGSENVETWYQCVIFEVQKIFPSKSVADTDTSDRLPQVGLSCSMDLQRDPTSKKGQWSERDKKEFYDSFNATRHRVVEQVGEERVDQWMTCAAERAEASYTSFTDANYDVDQNMHKIGAGCYAEVLRDPNSQKGQWSETDIQLLRDSFNSERSTITNIVGEERVEEWITCALDTSEQTLRSFTDANYDLDSQMMEIGAHCYKNILRDPNSKVGQWTETDKQMFSDSIKSIDSLVQTLGPDNVEPFAQCAVKQAEAQFSSFVDADYDTGSALVKIGEECSKIVLKLEP